MGVKIIHYGEDQYYRLRTLRGAGYSVDHCNSLGEFRWVLSSAGRADVVAFAESLGKAPHTAMSLARAQRSPLVLFQGWNPHYDESEFNLVVPMLTSAEHWLGDIASLIANTRRVIQSSSETRAAARKLREQMNPVHQKTILEFRRSATERERNRGFQIDFLRAGASHPEFSILPGWSGFLRSLGVDQIAEFNSLVRFSSHPAGTVLFAEDQLPGEIYIVMTGQVKLSVNSSEGKRFIVHIAHPGEVLGLAAAFSSCAQQLTAETVYPCDLASVGCSEFMQFLEKHPSCFRAAAEELGRAHNQVCARLRTVGMGSTVMAKLAGLLLEWSVGGNETEQGTQIRLALTHAEVGQCIGTTRETVTRILHDFQHRHVVDQNGSMLTILDRVALESCAGLR